MDRLTLDLLSLSRVERDERRRPETLVDLAAIVRGAVQTAQPIAEAAEVQVAVDCADTLPKVRGDADQLTQVTSNLIENAIKYGGSGKTVHVTLTRTE